MKKETIIYSLARVSCVSAEVPSTRAFSDRFLAKNSEKRIKKYVFVLLFVYLVFR